MTPPPLGEAGPLSEGGDGRQWRPSIADRGGSRDMSPKATGGVRAKSHCRSTEPLGSFSNSHFAAQNRGSCGFYITRRQTPSGPASPGHLPQRGRLPPSLREVSRPRRDGGSLPQNSAGRSPEKFSCQARLRFQNSGMKWRNFPCPHEPSLTTFKLTTSYPRLRSANSAKNPLGVFQTPILPRKTVVLAAYSHPSFKIPERPLWRNFPCPHESSFANAQLTRPKTPAGLFARADCPPRKIVLY